VAVAATVGASQLEVADLRVRYLLLEAGTFRIVDRSNHVVDGGRYHVNEACTPATMDIIGDRGPGAGRSMLAVFELKGDELTVCYDLEGQVRPQSLAPLPDRPLLRITYARAALPAL
jgi:uncharacterized protein (TIGR03067 family)